MFDDVGSKMKWKIRLHMILISLVLIGGLNWGLVAIFKYNLVESLSTSINGLFKSNLPINNSIYILVAVAALWLATSKTTWLPFLGNTVLPSSLLPLKKPEKTDKIVKVETKIPNAKVVYWAALPKGDKPPVEEAYSDYSNSGVVLANSEGVAEIPILTGSSYKVPIGLQIPRHIHYRVAGLPMGMMSRVMTVNY